MIGAPAVEALVAHLNEQVRLLRCHLVGDNYLVIRLDVIKSEDLVADLNALGEKRARYFQAVQRFHSAQRDLLVRMGRISHMLGLPFSHPSAQ